MNKNEDKKEGDADHIERVRRRAHSIWMDEGQVHGRDHEHWHQAEREIAAETSAHAPAAAEPRKASQAAAGDSKTTGTPPPSPKSATAGSSKTTESPKTESPLRTGS